MCMCRTRLTLEVVYSLVHLDSLPDRRPLLSAEEVAQLLEVFLILVERFRHLGDAWSVWKWAQPQVRVAR